MGLCILIQSRTKTRPVKKFPSLVGGAICQNINLNYEISGHERKSIIHINRLKPAYDAVIKKSNPRPRQQRRERTRETLSSERCEYPDAITLGRLPFVTSLPSRDDCPPALPTHLTLPLLSLIRQWLKICPTSPAFGHAQV